MVKRLSVILAVGSAIVLASCTSFWQAGAGGVRGGVSSSLVDYLYPKGEVPPDFDETVPQLELPLRVGIAFVPQTGREQSPISEATKAELLAKVKDAFITLDYIQHIEAIPDTYLRSSKGFEGMQQVARLYGVDVMALVSYDQVAVSEDKKSSMLYWTIVGAYIIEGTKNEVQTFVDTAVFDVKTRKLLFRAPGIDKHQSESTAIESIEVIRTSRAGSFAAAMVNMTENLAKELTKFEDRLETEPQLAQVTQREGYSGGGGSAGPSLLLLLLFLRLLRQSTSMCSKKSSAI